MYLVVKVVRGKVISAYGVSRGDANEPMEISGGMFRRDQYFDCQVLSEGIEVGGEINFK